MSETRFLQGKVVKRMLPLVQPPTGPETPRLKRLLLPQGELAEFHGADVGAHYIAYVELRPDQPRGNHFHKVKQEYAYIIKGEVLLQVEDIRSGERASITMRSGDLIFIAAEVAHTYKPLSAGHAVEFSEAPFDPTDTHRWVLE